MSDFKIQTYNESISKNRTFMMGLAMIGVLLFHHGFCYVPLLTPFFSRFGLWGVDIFLFLSGFGCAYALKKYSLRDYFVKRIFRILPVCLIVGVIIVSVDQYFHAEKLQASFTIRLLSLNRWYIQAIIICYILSPIIKIVIARFKLPGLIVLILIALLSEHYTHNIGIFRLNWILGRLPVFFIGMYLALSKVNFSKTHYVFFFCCFIIAILSRITNLGYFIFQWPLFLAMAMPIFCVVLVKMREILGHYIKIPLSFIIEMLGMYSLEIYLIHEYLYWVLSSLSTALWIKYLLFATLVLISCLIVKITHRIILRNILNKYISAIFN